MVKVRVSFRQNNIGTAKSLVKEIELAAIPVPGSMFMYEDGFEPRYLANRNEPGMHLNFYKYHIVIEGYGPQFNAAEVKSLQGLGWEII